MDCGLRIADCGFGMHAMCGELPTMGSQGERNGRVIRNSQSAIRN